MDRNACVELPRLSLEPHPELRRSSRPGSAREAHEKRTRSAREAHEKRTRSAREVSHLALIERVIGVTALRITELERRIVLLNDAGLDARTDKATLGLIRKSLLVMQRSKIEMLLG
jgi:hypothetical protein